MLSTMPTLGGLVLANERGYRSEEHWRDVNDGERRQLGLETCAHLGHVLLRCQPKPVGMSTHIVLNSP